MSLLYSKLDTYWLWKEIAARLGVSNPTYKYWPDAQSLQLNNKYLFLKQHTLPERYTYIEPELTSLAGYLPVRYASDQLHIDPHTFTSAKMALNRHFEYRFVENVKFVNLRRFFKEHGIELKRRSTVQMGRIGELDFAPTSTFYKINDRYGVVVDD